MPEHMQPPPVKRNEKSIVQSEVEARSARTTSKKAPEKVLSPRQIEEPSSVELAAGEWPFTSPMEKTTIDPKLTMQVPGAVRDLATKTIDQAEEAFGTFFDAARKSLASIRSPGTEISKQTLSFTEQSMMAAFDHARKLVQATDLQQAMQIQSEFLKSQFKNAGQHMQQITSEIMSSAKDASKDKF